MTEQAMMGVDVPVSRQPGAADLLNCSVKVLGRPLQLSGVLDQAPCLSGVKKSSSTWTLVRRESLLL